MPWWPELKKLILYTEKNWNKQKQRPERGHFCRSARERLPRIGSCSGSSKGRAPWELQPHCSSEQQQQQEVEYTGRTKAQGQMPWLLGLRGSSLGCVESFDPHNSRHCMDLSSRVIIAQVDLLWPWNSSLCVNVAGYLWGPRDGNVKRLLFLTVMRWHCATIGWALVIGGETAWDFLSKAAMKPGSGGAW